MGKVQLDIVVSEYNTRPNSIFPTTAELRAVFTAMVTANDVASAVNQATAHLEEFAQAREVEQADTAREKAQESESLRKKYDEEVAVANSLLLNQLKETGYTVLRNSDTGALSVVYSEEKESVTDADSVRDAGKTELDDLVKDDVV